MAILMAPITAKKRSIVPSKISSNSRSFHSIVRDIQGFKILQNEREIELDSKIAVRIRCPKIIERINRVQSALREFEQLSEEQKVYQYDIFCTWLYITISVQIIHVFNKVRYKNLDIFFGENQLSWTWVNRHKLVKGQKIYKLDV